MKIPEQRIPENLVIKIQIYFDANFLGLHKQSLIQTKRKLEKIFRQLQLLFVHKSLRTKINLEFAKNPIFVSDQV